MRQFLEIKKQHPDTLLLFRMGDFYETFFEDAQTVNRLLGLTITSRSSNGEGEPIPMAGVPFASVDQYLSRLVKHGMNVGLCEQLGVPGKGLMERKLVRIFTPGTLTDESLLSEKVESPLMAINPVRKSGKFALAWLTLSSGVFKTMEIPTEKLADEIARINPAEILVPERFRDELKPLALEASIVALPDWHFDEVRAEKTLKAQFGVATLESFGLLNQSAMISAAGVIIEYAQQTQGSKLPHIVSVSVVSDLETIALDGATLRNLEISQSIRNSQTNTLIGVIDHCMTAMGSRRLLSWLTFPSRSQEKALERSDTIAAILDKSSTLYSLSESLKGLPDFERITTRIALGTVRPRELAGLRDALPVLKKLAETATQIGSKLSVGLAKQIPVDDRLYQLLDAALMDVPNVYIRDGGVIAEGYSAELDQLRKLRDNSGQFLVEFEQKEKEKTKIPNLRVQYNSVHGYFIEVSKGQISKVPDYYQRHQTLKNVERYTTPELKVFEKEVVSAQEKSLALEKELFDDVLSKCKAYCSDLLSTAEAISTLDCLYSLAWHADNYRWIRPTFTKRQKITIKAGRHPVVEKAIENYVPNDCTLDQTRRLLIITGPNMGGKSTYMRSIALIVLLAYIGSFVPAETAEIGPIDKILTRIGAADDLAKGLSTFMVEMTESASILRNATEQSLVLMDEVGRGTSTFDGLSLAGAIAEDLAVNRKSMTLFATHYFELTQLEKLIGTVANVHVSAAETSKDIVFLHEIEEGPANQSYGIAVAKLAGVPKNVIKGAQKLLAKLEEQASKVGDTQLDLFLDNQRKPIVSDNVEPEDKPEKALIDELLHMDLDELSPRQAWEVLSNLQKLAKSLPD